MKRANLVIALATAAGLTAAGCTGSTQEIKKTGPDEPEVTKNECEKDSDCQQDFYCTEEALECVFDDRIRKDVTVEAPTYVEGISHEAQDEFRQGVQHALSPTPEYSEALLHFEKAVELDKRFLEAWFNIAMVYESQRQPEKALETYQRALKENPDSEDAQAFVGKIYLANARRAQSQGKEAEAQQLMAKAKGIFDSVLAKDFENIPANNAMALYWLLVGDKAKADEHVKQVLVLEPMNVTALNTRGLIFLQSGELNFARWIFEQKVLQLDPSSIEAHTNLGTVFVKQKDLPRAVKHFKRAVALDNNNVEARMNLGAIFIDFLNYEGAKEQYETILKLQPENVEAIIGLGSSELGLGDLEQAIGQYEKAIKLDKRRAILLKRVGELFEKKGQKKDIETALGYYKRYVQLSGVGPEDMISRKIVVLEDALKQGMFDAPPPEPKTPDAPDGTPPADGGAAPDAAPTGDAAAPAEPAPTEPAPADPAPEAPAAEPEAAPDAQ